MEVSKINCEDLDKRTKEYKECVKLRNESKGLGDTVEKITKATGIKKVVDKVAETLGVDCGCEERKERLNKLFPYRKTECATPEEVAYLKNFFANKPAKLDFNTQGELIKIYNRIFNERRKVSSCSPCVNAILDSLKTIV